MIRNLCKIANTPQKEHPMKSHVSIARARSISKHQNPPTVRGIVLRLHKRHFYTHMQTDTAASPASNDGRRQSTRKSATTLYAQINETVLEPHRQNAATSAHRRSSTRLCIANCFRIVRGARFASYTRRAAPCVFWARAPVCACFRCWRQRTEFTAIRIRERSVCSVRS